MKIGIISDIHSNIVALEAVFDFFKSNNITKVICLGDIIGIGPYPEKCVDFLMKNNDIEIICIQGNHEKYLINGIKRHNHKDSEPMTDEELSVHYWNHLRINEKEKKFISNLKKEELIQVENKKIVITHYPSDDENKYKKYIKDPDLNEIRKLFDNYNADIYLYGHTHKAKFINDNNKFYINPGTVGCPKGNSGASIGILEITCENIKYENKIVNYDVKSVINNILELDYPICKKMIDYFYI